MGRARPDLFVEPHLGEALRWLRWSRGMLRQTDVVERMAAAGAGISVVWLSQLETGKGHPTHATLDALLTALDSDRKELGELLRSRPWRVEEGTEWESSPRTRVVAPPPAVTPRRQVAVQAAELGALFALLDAGARREVLADVRRRVEGT